MNEPNQFRLRLWYIAVLAGVLAYPCQANQRNPGPDGGSVRVGIVAFDEHGADHQRLHRVLREVMAASPAPLRFQVARGTYGDVAHWMHQGHIDLAIVTPALFRLGESLPASDVMRDKVRYLATVTAAPAVTRFASDERKTAGRHDRVHTLTLVKRDSPLRSAADLDRAARDGRLRVLLVHPLSVSGGIAPRYALAERGIDLSAVQIEHTDSHSGSVRALLENHTSGNSRPADAGPETVAFVWDDALRSNPELADGLRAIPFPELDRLDIPTEVVVAHSNFARADEVQRLLVAHRDADRQASVSVQDDWRELFGEVARWRFAAGARDERGDLVTLDEIGRLLVLDARTQSRPPRLGLVLSGGGAKCSYQVGAVAAIEEQLAALRAANPKLDLDLHLVVGTSGGAINALPVALGITSTAAGREHFQTVWKSLDQRDIVRPSRLARANVGLWFVLVQAVIVLFIVRRLVPAEARRLGWMGALFTALGAVQLVLAYVDFKPWRMLGTSHLVHHLWLWLSFGSPAAGWGLLVLGVAAVALALMRSRKGSLVISGRFVRPVLWLGLIGLPLLHIVTVLFFQHTLSGGEGMERALATHYPELIDGELARRGLPALDLSTAASDVERLRMAGKQIVERGLPARDLVITGSRLQSSDKFVNALPSDLYFYLARHETKPAATEGPRTPPFGPRGFTLRERPDLLLDVVLGSGSIFPVFPSRSLPDFPAAGAEVDLVDGGFAHNSPIEAAVLWGATHIIVIEASPQVRLERTNFATNAVATFAHLYEQSQLLDARARGKVAIFTLAPRPPHLCVLDFADNLIEDSIARGYADARGHSTDDAASATTRRTSSRAARFRKEAGEPAFVDLRTDLQ
jgi:predicted acylesterase/phospholipase RssA/ABC-type phosphate/phosphonate transport system substrate-binding protein